MPSPIELQNKLKQNNKKIITFVFLFVILILLVFFKIMTEAPSHLEDIMIKVEKNQSPISVFEDLKDKKAIKSIKLMKFFLKIIDQNGKIKAGNYLIKKDTPVYKIAKQLNQGRYGIEPIKIIIREGLNNEEISEILEKEITGFNKESFIVKAEGKEGYLFPDTYFFYGVVSEDEIIDEMTANFNKKMRELRDLIEKNKRTEKEIIIMASILEGEASGKEDINLISGILWKRLDKNMLLQVDVDRSTYEKNGLPESPLNNPGLMSIEASLNPNSSLYYYYLHDRDGQVHFAENYEEHCLNIKNYLKN
jgi:UPF0755 protein